MKRLFGGSSDSKARRYASGPTRIPANKKRKLLKHIKKHPNDLQAKRGQE